MVAPDPLGEERPSPDGPARDDPPKYDDSTAAQAHSLDQNDDDHDDDSADAVPDLPSRPAKSPDPAEVQSQLRQRRALRTSFGPTSPTMASPLHESASPPPSRSQRRSSSFVSNTSASSRPSLRSSDSFFSPGVPKSRAELHQDHEPTLWHSAPLLFAVVPAIAGVVFKKGSVLITDLVLLCLAAVYLNWCLVTPWTWYREAQGVLLAERDDEAVADDLGQAARNIADDLTEPTEQPEHTGEPDKDKAAQSKQDTTSASQELAVHELLALICCFIGPLAGALLLHTIRTSLSSFGDELVSNMHLTLFVLGAELRPIRHAVKLVHARTLYLQRTVRADQLANSPGLASRTGEQLSDLQSRLDELERAVADSTAAAAAKAPAAAEPSKPDGPPGATIETVKKAQSALQTQIDALNRAVRRYEKRATAQTLQTESTLADLETRLKDALALAAAAASYSQKPGVLDVALRGVRMPLVALSQAVMAPVAMLARLLVSGLARLGFVRKTERKRVVRRTGSGGPRTAKDKERERFDKVVSANAANAARAYR